MSGEPEKDAAPAEPTEEARDLAAPAPARIRRFQIGLNVIVQIVLAICILGLVNYLGFRHYERWDLSRDQQFALSGQTEQILKQLDEPVRVIVYFSPESLIYRDVDYLLREYQYAARGRLVVENVDPYRNLARARELVNEYRLGPQEDVLIVVKGDRHRFLYAPDLAEWDASGAGPGWAPEIRAFKGEQALSSVLLELLEDRQRIVRYVVGHGEPDPGPQANLQTWRMYVERENVDVKPLNLMEIDAIPEETDLLMIAGPEYDFTEREIDLLRTYWEHHGPMFVLTNPMAATPRLDAFLAEKGIIVRQDRVIRTFPLAAELIGVLQDVATHFLPGSPITAPLQGLNGQLPGGAQSLDMDEALAESESIRLVPLMEAVEGFWGETDYERGAETGYWFDPETDHGAPLYTAVSAEKGAVDDDRVQVDTSRLVAVGSFVWITDEGLQGVSLDFFLGAMNWLMDREELIGIVPKERTTIALNLSQDQVLNIRRLAVYAIPALVALLGFAVWWQRRR